MKSKKFQPGNFHHLIYERIMKISKNCTGQLNIAENVNNYYDYNLFQQSKSPPIRTFWLLPNWYSQKTPLIITIQEREEEGVKCITTTRRTLITSGSRRSQNPSTHQKPYPQVNEKLLYSLCIQRTIGIYRELHSGS